MTGRKLVSTFAALAFSMSLAAGPVLAKPKNPCKPGGPRARSCSNEIKGCIGTSFCKDRSVKGRARAQCIRNCRTTVINACKQNNAVCTASPSGAFLEVALQ